MSEQRLFTPTRLGAIPLANRVVMAPLTRNRATHDGDVPSDLAVDYYRQRAGAGLIITEATQILPEGKGYAWTPGIHSQAQIDGWRKINDAVHAEGGKIVIQLWHVGRISHVSLQPDGQAPVAPSAIAAKSQTFNGEAFVETSTPRALETDEVIERVEAYRQAARNALQAGFDGVEIHAANGYLIDQFLRDGTNKRTDQYGGSIQNRARFLFDVTEAVIGIVGNDRTGIRLSPMSGFNDIADSDPEALFSYVLAELNKYDLAYVHMIEGETGGPRDAAGDRAIADLRKHYKGSYVANNGYDRDRALEAVESGHADAVAFGRLFISNPDLVTRLQRDATLAEPDSSTFYGGDHHGYTDYPALDEAANA